VGDELTYSDQMKAAKGVHFIPYSQCPLRTVRKDCIYYSTPAMVVPKAFENLHSCEVNSCKFCYPTMFSNLHSTETTYSASGESKGKALDFSC
jgi:WAX2 C-terminal domain